MNRVHIIIFILSFAAGVLFATLIGLAVLPTAHQAWRDNADSDVYRPLEGALQHIEHSLAQGDPEKAAAQLHLLNRRFAEYRAGGATPAAWWNEIVATTQPAR